MESESGQTKGSLKVLHLEDDALDAELIQLQLKRHALPCTITRICNRGELETALQSEPVDLILSDSCLPGFDTLRALDFVRKQRPNVPFVFVSGSLSPELKAEAVMRGAMDYISKNNLSPLVRVVRCISRGGGTLPNRPLPDPGKPVIVQCREFRCLGFLDGEGLWRDFSKASPLGDVVDWTET